MLPKQFQISFDFKPTKWVKGWANIVHFTTGSSCCGLGSRIPAFFPSGGKIAITFAVNRNGNYKTWTPKLALNKWVHFSLNQRLEGKNYVYQVYMNKVLLRTIVNRSPRDYKNVKVFVADTWTSTQPGFVKNLRITNKAIVPSGKF